MSVRFLPRQGGSGLRTNTNAWDPCRRRQQCGAQPTLRLLRGRAADGQVLPMVPCGFRKLISDSPRSFCSTATHPYTCAVQDSIPNPSPEPAKVEQGFAAARARLWSDEMRAREALDATYHAALATGLAEAARQAAALAVCSYALHFADFRSMTTWCARFSSAGAGASAGSARSLFVAGATIALPILGVGTYEDPALDAAADRLFRGLKNEAGLHDDERLALAKVLAEYYSMRHDAQAIRRLMLMAAPWLEHAQPMARGVWWLMHAVGEQQFGSPALAETSVAQAREIAQTHQVATLQMALSVQSLRAALQAEDLDEAERLLQIIRPLSLRLKPGQHRSGLHLEAMDALLRGEPKRARDLLDLLLKVCDDVEVPQRDRGVYHVYQAYVQLELDDLPGALQALVQARIGQSGAQQQMVECVEQLVGAGHALLHDTPQAELLLRSARGMAAAMQYPMFFAAQPALAAKLAQAAFTAGIEADFVAAAVRKRRLAPPDPMREDWPWTLKLRALGNFVIEREGRVVAFDGKAQKKPLELLKALIALGGEALPREVLALALWPAADADAVKNFDVTLSRLRKLLEVDGAIALADGKVSLNRRLVWWDVAAFEARCAGLHTALHSARHDPADDAAVTPLAAEVFRLHRDKLFGDEPAAAWSVAARERLAVKFNRAVSDVGAWLEARGRYREAIDRYERGLAQQMLAEPLYRGLMRCHLALHEPAEALVAYRRCRDMLLILLSVKPSAATEAVHQRIRAA